MCVSPHKLEKVSNPHATSKMPTSVRHVILQSIALRMDPRLSALPFTDIRALMSRCDSQTVDDELQAQRA
jgi:hypothetical protein